MGCYAFNDALLDLKMLFCKCLIIFFFKVSGEMVSSWVINVMYDRIQGLWICETCYKMWPWTDASPTPLDLLTWRWSWRGLLHRTVSNKVLFFFLVWLWATCFLMAMWTCCKLWKRMRTEKSNAGTSASFCFSSCWWFSRQRTDLVYLP